MGKLESGEEDRRWSQGKQSQPCLGSGAATVAMDITGQSDGGVSSKEVPSS